MAEILGYAVWLDGTPEPVGLNIDRIIHDGGGSWHIWFNFEIEDAVEIASIGHFETAGWITAYGDPPLGPNAVTVMTGTYSLALAENNGDVAGAIVPQPVDLTFQLLVIR